MAHPLLFIILKFMEDHGKAVKDTDFLDQFNGLSKAEDAVVGAKITAVSKATQSSKAVSEAVRKVLFAFNEFVKGLKQ